MPVKKIKHYKPIAAIILLFLFSVSAAIAQPSFSGKEHLFSTPESYVAIFAPTSPVIDGDLSDAVWDEAPWSNYFRDIEGDKRPTPTCKTRVKMAWNNSSLFIAAELQEPHIWAYLRQRDTIVYYDNDFEVFIDPYNTTHNYFEIEVNALNTIFDLFMPKPYRNGSDALVSWNTPGMCSAVKIHGTLNNASDIDSSWTVEMEIPFASIRIGYPPNIPKDGSIWRINFSRVEWDTEIVNGNYIKKKDANGKTLPEHNWVWSPQGVVNMHCPERWGYLQFSGESTRKQLPGFILPYEEKLRCYLWLVYYRQKEYFNKHKKYAPSLAELNIIPDKFHLEGEKIQMQMEATNYQFTGSIRRENGKQLTINDEGLIK